MFYQVSNRNSMVDINECVCVYVPVLEQITGLNSK